MALDSSFLVGGAPTPLLNPLDIQAKKIAIQNALAAGVLNQQAIAGGELELQQKRQAIADDLKTRAYLAQLYGQQGSAQNPTAPPTPNNPAVGPGPADSSGLSGSAVPGVPTLTAGAQGTPANALAPGAPPAAAPASAAPAGAPPAAAPAPAAAPPPAPAAAPPPAPVKAPTMQDLLAAGVPPANASAVVLHFQAADKGAADIQNLQSEAADKLQEYQAELANAAAKSGADPTVIKYSLQHAAQMGPQYAQMAQSVAQQIAPMNRAQQVQFFQNMANSSKGSREAAAAEQTAGAKAATDTATADDKNRITILQRLSDATNQDQYRAMVNALTPTQRALANPPDPNTWTAATRGALKNQQLTGEQSATLAETAARDRQTALHEGQTVGLESARVGIEGARLSLEQKKAGGALGALSPADQLISQKLSTGDFNPAQLGRMPNKEAIMAGAIELNPNWTPAVYDVKQSFRTDKDGTLGGITRVLGHLDSYAKNSNALGFSLFGSLGINNVTPAQTRVATDANAITEEFGKLVKSGSLTQAQAERAESGLTSSRPDIRAAAASETLNLMKSQFEGRYQRYKTATGLVFPAHEFFDAPTMNRLQAAGALPEGYVRPAAAPAPGGAPAAGVPHGVPELGSTFNGQRVLSVTRIQ